MKRIALLTFICLMLNVATAQDKPILVTPAWLNEHLGDPNLVILQVSSLEFDYAKEHIPGARFLWTGWLAPNTPKGSFNAPDPKFAMCLMKSAHQPECS